MKNILHEFISQLWSIVLSPQENANNRSPRKMNESRTDIADIIVPYKVGSPSVPWFFIHPGGAGAEAYKGLSEILPDNINFYAVDSYHLKFDATAYQSIETLADLYISALKKTHPKGPIFLGGWSLGGIIAYEMAIRLERLGIKVLHIIMLDSYFLTQQDGEHKMQVQAVSDLWLQHSDLYMQLPDSYQQHLLAVSRGESQMIANYRGGSYQGEITLFKANLLPDFDKLADHADIEKYVVFNSELICRKKNGWDMIASNLRVLNMNTTHWGIMDGDCLSQLKEMMSRLTNEHNVSV